MGDDLTEFLRQSHFIIAAPAPFILLLTALGAAIFAIVRKYYEGQISTLTSRLSLRDDEIASLKRQPIQAVVPQLPVAAKAPETERRAISHRLYRVLGDTRRSLADNRTERAAELAMPALTALLLSLNKDYGIPLAKSEGSSLFDVEVACRILEAIGPLIQHGHDKEARVKIGEFIQQLGEES